MSDWSYKTAGEISAALAAGQVSAVELTEDAIARIEDESRRRTADRQDEDRLRPVDDEAGAALIAAGLHEMRGVVFFGGGQVARFPRAIPRPAVPCLRFR